MKDRVTQPAGNEDDYIPDLDVDSNPFGNAEPFDNIPLSNAVPRRST